MSRVRTNPCEPCYRLGGGMRPGETKTQWAVRSLGPQFRAWTAQHLGLRPRASQAEIAVAIERWAHARRISTDDALDHLTEQWLLTPKERTPNPFRAWTDPETGKDTNTDAQLMAFAPREDIVNWWLGEFGFPRVQTQLEWEAVRPQLSAAIDAWAEAHGVPPEITLFVLRDHYWLRRSPPGPGATVLVDASYLRPGMAIVTPDFIRQDVPDAAPVLLVDLWNFEEGESSLLDTKDGGRYDYNTADFPPDVEVVLPPQGSTKAQEALAEINAHRLALLMPPLDPVLAGWTDEDLIVEAERLRKQARNPLEQKLLHAERQLGAVRNALQQNPSLQKTHGRACDACDRELEKIRQNLARKRRL